MASLLEQVNNANVVHDINHVLRENGHDQCQITTVDEAAQSLKDHIGGAGSSTTNPNNYDFAATSNSDYIKLTAEEKEPTKDNEGLVTYSAVLSDDAIKGLDLAQGKAVKEEDDEGNKTYYKGIKELNDEFNSDSENSLVSKINKNQSEIQNIKETIENLDNSKDSMTEDDILGAWNK